MTGTLNTGGIIMLEDCVTDSAFCVPETSAFRTFLQGWIEISAANNLDPRIGERLPALLHGAGIRSKQYAIFQPLLTNTDDRRLIPMCVEETREAHIEFGVVNAEAADRVIADLYALADDLSTSMGFVRNHLVMGQA